MGGKFIILGLFLVYSLQTYARTVASPAKSLCDEVFAEISGEEIKEIEAVEEGASAVWIVEYLENIAAKRAVSSNQEEVLREARGLALEFDVSNRFFPIIKPLEKGETMHTFPGGGDSPTSDHVFALRLPQPGEKTLWSQLDPKARKALVEALQAAFRKTNYDLKTADERQVRRYGSDIAQTINFMDNANDYKGAGLVPLQMLKAALNKNKLGICGHGNGAIVGLLYELGASPQEVRLVTGYPDAKSKEGHAWFEYRTTPSGKWNEGDATPKSGTPLSELEKLLAAYIKPKPNRELFPHTLLTHEDFYNGTTLRVY